MIKKILTVTSMMKKKIPVTTKITTMKIMNTKKIDENELADIILESNQFQVPHETEEEQEIKLIK